MTKFYRNVKTGEVITEADYKERLLTERTEVGGSDMGLMGMNAYTSGVNQVINGGAGNMEDYEPYDPEEEAPIIKTDE